MIDTLMRAGRDVQVFLRDFSAHVRQVAAFRLGAQPALEMTGASAERYRAQGEEISLPRLLRMLELSMQAEADTRFTSSPRGVLELFALRACRVTDGNDTEALIAQVEDLSHQIELLKKNGVVVTTAAPVAAQPVKAAPAVKKTPAMHSAESEAPGGRKPSEVWNAALKRLGKEAVAAYAIINQGRFGGYRDGRYTLIFEASNGISRDFVNAPERKGLIEKILTEEGGAPVQFEAVLEGANNQPQLDKQKKDEDLLIDILGRDKVQIDND